MCICIDTDGESVTLLTEKTRRARKIHTCHECHGPIFPGQEYEYLTWVYDGKIDKHKTCSPCVEIRERLMTCGYFYDQIWSDINNALDSIGIGDLDGLSLDAIGKFEEMTRDACCDCGCDINGPGKYLPWGEGPFCDECFKSFEDKGEDEE
jgi:hypothetical protein